MALDNSTIESEKKLSNYENYLESDPNNTRLLRDIADICYQLGKFDKAENYLERILALSYDASTAYQLSNVYLAKADYERAITILSTMKERGYNDPAIDFNLAYGFYASYRAEDAFELLNGIKDQLASIPRGYTLLLKSMHYLAKIDEAIALLDEILENNGQTQSLEGLAIDEGLLGAAALLYYDAGESEKARTLADQSLQQNSHNYESLVVSGLLKTEAYDTDNAVKDLSAGLAINPNGSRALSGLGMAYAQLQEPDNAIDALEKAIKYSPRDFASMHSLAWMYIVKGQYDKANAILDTAVKIDRTFSETYGTRAVIEIAQGKRAEAEKNIEIALRLNKNSYSGRFAKALLVQNLDSKQSEQIMNNIMASTPPGSDLSVIELMQKNLALLKNRKLH